MLYNYNLISKPMDITCRNLAYPSNNHIKYLFELLLKFKNGETIKFRKMESCNECEIVSTIQQIKYDDILHFQISIAQITVNETNIFTLNGDICLVDKSEITKNENIYIEFIKDSYSDFVICTTKLFNSESSFGVSPS
jgi:hypothetical protein